MKRWILFAMLAVLLIAGCAADTSAPAAEDADMSSPAADEKPEADTSTPAAYSNITVAVRRNGQIVSERAVTGAKETEEVQRIIFDYMIKSAAWEGIEVSELEDCVILSFDQTGDSERQSFYQYDTEGSHALQAGEAGMYTIMSGGAYDMLLQLAGLASETAISVEEATALLQERFGERDAETGNTFSFGYLGRFTVGETEYFRFRVSWLVDNDHLSYLTDYLVSTDGKTMLEYAPQETDAP